MKPLKYYFSWFAKKVYTAQKRGTQECTVLHINLVVPCWVIFYVFVEESTLPAATAWR